MIFLYIVLVYGFACGFVFVLTIDEFQLTNGTMPVDPAMISNTSTSAIEEYTSRFNDILNTLV